MKNYFNYIYKVILWFLTFIFDRELTILEKGKMQEKDPYSDLIDG